MSKGSFSSTPPNPVGVEHCPYCDAEYRPTADGRCWLCWQPLTPGGTEAPVSRRTSPVVRGEPAGQGAGWIVFGVLALVISLGLAFDAPGILIGVVIVALPAAIRTLVLASRHPADSAGTLLPRNLLATFL